jgi:hypothetical protein
MSVLYVKKNMKNKQKEWHLATKPLINWGASETE